MAATQQSRTASDLTFRRPALSDAQNVWRLIGECPPLDVNSSYAYLLLCDHFAATSVVAELEGKLSGFISGYLIPERPDSLFIWQVAVHERARGLGLGRGMILDILGRDVCSGVTQLETTVSPSNEASRRMFASAARALGTELNEREHYDFALMAEEGHESENLITIGPIEQRNQA